MLQIIYVIFLTIITFQAVPSMSDLFYMVDPNNLQ